ncbi:MAG TPA: bifunctional 23S rRNA (guanine(2069)-N(7))-methyltransferase RlmK/23S rRNA (guanine(2445)-N(2))-methyltransferase RlmL, partial [Gammaproteobacteria bacterium]|nr:bifunctional 23S rRNA (guanine(2069)-N(7))-methyltransferase RlmK/23S rRNA (guanine(2445)-N(2))-methyltransferase RlmL [Gammaproteobacteria bacterium]
MSLRYFASAPRGFEDLLEAEIERLGAAGLKRRPGGVGFRGSLETGYRVCLWSRLAEHVLLQVGEFPAATPEELYRGISGILWREHLDASGTLAVTFVSRHSGFRHTHFAALRVKDAVVDQFRAATGARPSVELKNPDLRIHVFAERDRVSVYIDLAGAPLHRRGYRVRPLAAPVKETLAAGILMRAGWPQILARGGALIDPMCGSGTFLVEGAWMALDFPPGGLREQFGFMGWNRHDRALWGRLREEAGRHSVQHPEGGPPILGFDADADATAAAAANLARAGLTGRVRLETRPLSELERPPGVIGLLVTNPPYGERLDNDRGLEALYGELGQTLKSRFAGFEAAVLAGEPAPVEAIGLKPHHVHRVFNGPIRCRLLRYTLHASGKPDTESRPPGAKAIASVDATDFANRLNKNLRRLRRWAKRNNIDCYRIYDADVPEYALAVDLYQGESLWAHVQEYAAPPSVDPRRAGDRLGAALAAIPEVLGIEKQRVVFKRRQRQREKRQYERVAATDEYMQVQEAGCRLLVNLKDRIDTGLYLDHRPIRMLIRELSGGRSFLNLFAYTGTASVQAAAGGARTTLSVDMSTTYNEWGQRNLKLNNLCPPDHRYLRADCIEWISAAPDESFDLALLDPPTFSNSKR